MSVSAVDAFKWNKTSLHCLYMITSDYMPLVAKTPRTRYVTTSELLSFHSVFIPEDEAHQGHLAHRKRESPSRNRCDSGRSSGRNHAQRMATLCTPISINSSWYFIILDYTSGYGSLNRVNRVLFPHGGLLPSITKLWTTAAGTPRSSVATASFGIVGALHGSWPPEAARIPMWNQLLKWNQTCPRGGLSETFWGACLI